MIKIKYKDWYEIDTDDTHGFRKKDHTVWAQESFTLFLRCKTDWDALVKEEGENTASCIVGKPGMHLGLMVTPEHIFKFDFWTNVDGEIKYGQVASRLMTEGKEFINIFVSHDAKNKKIDLFIYDEKEDERIHESTTYEGVISDYTWCPTYIGCAFHDREQGWPHNNFWAGDISYFKIIDEYVDRETIDEMIYFDIDELTKFKNDKAYFILDGVRQTESSIFDISNNNNHARFKKQEIYKKYNSPEEKQNTKNQIL